MWKPLALVLVCGAVASTVQVALAQTEGGDTPIPSSTASPEKCTPAKQIYTPRHWRERNPARGVSVCRGAGTGHLRRWFGLYQHYRHITPYRCQKGAYGTWAIPCYVIACESKFSWSAANSSGAVGPYQLLGWGAPYPARSFRARVRNHEIAHSLSLSNWTCA